MYPGSVKLLQSAMSKPSLIAYVLSDCLLLYMKCLLLCSLGQALNDGRSNLIAKVIVYAWKAYQFQTILLRGSKRIQCFQ